MSDFRFLICPVLSMVPIGEIQCQDVTFLQSVDGTGTSFTAGAPLSLTQSADKLRSLLNYPGDPKHVAIYVYDGSIFLWGGVLQTRAWDKDKRQFNLTATSWKAWLYQRFIGPNAATNPVTDVSYAWTGTEQFDIARAILNYAVAGVGTPTIGYGSETSGVHRDMNFYGSEFRKAGEIIDSMASRFQGFEWDIEVDTDSLSHPKLRMALYYPKNTGVNTGVIFNSIFDSTPSGGNILAYDNPDDTAEIVVTRCWGTGSGNSGTDILMAYDQDPALVNDTILLVETKEYANSSTTDVGTIQSHVQGIRAFHASGLQHINVTVPLDNPDYADYNIGDKIRLVVQDDMLDIDYSAARLVRRTFKVNGSGSSPGLDTVTNMIDLNDTGFPADDTTL